MSEMFGYYSGFFGKNTLIPSKPDIKTPERRNFFHPFKHKLTAGTESMQKALYGLN
jgi:hypothetical protein